MNILAMHTWLILQQIGAGGGSSLCNEYYKTKSNISKHFSAMHTILGFRALTEKIILMKRRKN